MTEQNSKRGIAWQMLLLSIIMVGFPVGSWLYMNKGYNYRYDALQELQDFGQLPSFTAENHKAKIITSADLKGKYAVIGFTNALDGSIMRQKEQLYTEFGTSKEVVFLSYLAGVDSVAIHDYAKAQIKDTLQHWHLFTGDFGTLETAVHQEPARIQGDYLALVDTFGVIRRYYNTKDDKDIGEMARHMAMFIAPMRDERGELKFRREIEK